MMDTISPEPEFTAQAFYIKRLRFIVDSNSTSDKSRFTLDADSGSCSEYRISYQQKSPSSKKP
ncbi:hypothetical protein ACSFU9_002983, partial [Escherichia coli]